MKPFLFVFNNMVETVYTQPKFVYVSDLHKSSLSNNINTGLHRYRLDANKKLSDMIDEINADDTIDFAIMNGDCIDRGNSDKSATLADLANIDGLFGTMNVDKYYSFGNHDLDNISKPEFMSTTGMSDEYYSFDKNGIHYIVLDSCYSLEDDSAGYDTGNYSYRNTWINPTQKGWLISDLASTGFPCIIFLHNQLDDNAYLYPVGNRSDIRTILENSGKVKTVIQGHLHSNYKSVINGISYITMNAMCMYPYPQTSWAKITVNPDGTVSVEGFGVQDNY